ncbi:hypothetical protein CsSME_00038904 [Camellia sinensis var. sinensis]
MLQLFLEVAFSAVPLTLYVPPVRSLNLFVGNPISTRVDSICVFAMLVLGSSIACSVTPQPDKNITLSLSLPYYYASIKPSNFVSLFQIHVLFFFFFSFLFGCW